MLSSFEITGRKTSEDCQMIIFPMGQVQRFLLPTELSKLLVYLDTITSDN